MRLTSFLRSNPDSKQSSRKRHGKLGVQTPPISRNVLRRQVVEVVLRDQVGMILHYGIMVYSMQRARYTGYGMRYAVCISLLCTVYGIL